MILAGLAVAVVTLTVLASWLGCATGRWEQNARATVPSHRLPPDELERFARNVLLGWLALLAAVALLYVSR